MENPNKDLLQQRLHEIHDRIARMANAGSDSLHSGNTARDGSFWSEKLKLCDEAERILEKLEEGLG